MTHNDAMTDDLNWEDFSQGLMSEDPVQYIQDIRENGTLKHSLPEIDALFGIPQAAKSHPEIDTGAHTMMALKKAVDLKGDLSVRFAALVHDIDKALTDPEMLPRHEGHEEAGVIPVQNLTERLGTPDDVKSFAVHFTRYHLYAHRMLDMQPKSIVTVLDNVGAIENSDMFENFILAAQSDAQGRLGMENKPYPQADFMRAVLKAVQDIDIDDLTLSGLENTDIQEQLHIRRIDAVRELQNNFDANTPP